MCVCDLGVLCFQVMPMCLIRCDVVEFGSCCRLSRCLPTYLCIKIHRVRSTPRSGSRQQPTAMQTLCCPLVSDHSQPLISFHIPTANNKLRERLYCLSTCGDTVPWGEQYLLEPPPSSESLRGRTGRFCHEHFVVRAYRLQVLQEVRVCRVRDQQVLKCHRLALGKSHELAVFCARCFNDYKGKWKI